MDLHQSLYKLGLNENQTKVYLSALQLGEDTVLNIAKYATVKRPSAYIILDELESRGLVSKVKRSKKTLYRAEHPKRIISQLQAKQEIAENILPSLNAIYNVDPDKPNIKIADGVASVRNTYNDIFTYLESHPKEELIIFGSLADALDNFETEVVDYFYALMRNSKSKVREIGNDDKDTRKYFRASKRLNPNHDIRFIKKHEDVGHFWKTDDMLYGNTLVIFSVKKDIFAIIIESETIARTYRTLFNMAWVSGKKI